MGTLLQDVRYAVRMMWKKPGFTVVAAGALALGIGANTTIFSLVNALLLRPLGGVGDSSRLVAVHTSDFSSGLYGSSSFPDYLDLREQCEAFAGLAGFEDAVANLNADDEAERLRGQSVTGNYFSVLGVGAAAGRLLTEADEEASSAERIVVVSHDLWRRRFGSDPGLVGRSVLLDGRPHTVVGVASEEFRGTRLGSTGPAFWLPFERPVVAARSRGSRGMHIVGRLKDGATIEQAQAEVSNIAARLAQSYPKTNLGTLARPEEPRPMSVSPETRVGAGRERTVWMASALLLAVVGFVLLIACANVANMMLARASTRRREIAIRLALGAGRLRIVQQLLTESLLLAAAGGAVGLLVALWTADLLPSFFPREDASALDFSLDWRVLGFAAGVSLISGVLFGLAPALQATRPDVVVALKDDAGAGVLGRRPVNLRNALVVAQVALSLALLIGAGLFLRSLRNAAGADPGFDAAGVLIAQIELRGEGAKAERGQALYGELLERVTSLAGVRSAALTRIVPLSGGGMRRTVYIEGYEPRPGEDIEINTNVVSAGYFETMRIPLVAGRDFGPQDVKEAPGVVVVNEEFARRYLGGPAALGKTMRADSRGPQLEVVGIARDGKYRDLREDTLPLFYLPLAQNYAPGVALVVRAEGDPTALLQGVRGEIAALDKNLPVFGVNTLEGHLAAALSADRMIAVLLSVFGGAALLLASVGIYGVMSYMVAQRTREIGIRMALGARAGDILAMVVRQGMTLVVVGGALGLGLALAVTRVLRSLLYGVSATDPLTYAGIALLLGAVALLACYLPARRAARVDPMVALRYE